MRILLAGPGGRVNKLLHNEVLAKGWEAFFGYKGCSANEYIALIKEHQIDCIVDFSNKSFWPILNNIIIQTKIPLISGTTGLDDVKSQLEAWGREIPVCYAANFSLGMQLVNNFLRHCPKIEYNNVLIEEAHHALKKDRPSGTALTLARLLNVDSTLIDVRREGSIPGMHRVTLCFDDQEVILEHRVINRAVYAKGALSIVPFLIQKAPGCYEFNEFFDRGI